MKEHKIYIDDTEVDLYDPNNLDLAITLSISDSNDLTKRKGSNTKTIKIPATANNKKIFGHPEDFNSVVNVDQQTKPTAKIEGDGTRIFNGFAKINGTTEIASQKITEYDLNCIGDNGDWVYRLPGKKISDIDFSDQNHLRTVNKQNESETVSASRDYVYDLIDRGEFTGQMYPISAPTKRSVNIADRYPALKIRSILIRMINAIGYKVSSAFIDNTFFRSLYLPYVNDRLNIDQSFKDNLVCQIRSLINGQNIPPSATQKIEITEDYYSVYGNSIFYNNYMFGSPSTPNPSGAFGFANQNEYFVKSSGKYKIEGYLAVHMIFTGSESEAASTSLYFNVMKKNRYKDGIGRSIFFKSSRVSDSMYGGVGGGYIGYGPTSFSGVETPVDFTYSFGDFDLEYGDEIYYEITTSAKLHVYITDVHFGVSEINNIYGVGEGQYFDFNLNLPDDSQIDFIVGLKELFNLHFVTDVESRTIYIEPYDDFYNGEIEDWSSKLDKSRDVQINFTGSELSKTIRYSYKSDSNDKFVSEWEKQNLQSLGEEKQTLQNVFAKDETKEIQNTLFCPTWMDTCKRIGLTTSYMPRMWSDVSLPEKSTKFGARILVYGGKKTLPNGESWRMNPIGTISYQSSNPNSGVRTTYPHFYSYDDSQVNDNNLMYSDKHYSHGLFQKFYRNAQTIIDDGRNFLPYLKLNDLDISNIDFRRKKYIEEEGNGSYFILDKVDNYKSQDNVSTLCILTKVLSSKKLASLPYQSGYELLVPHPPKNNIPGLRVTEDGAIQSKGIEVFTPTVDGELVSGGSNMVVEVDGVLQPIYYLDSQRNYQLMKNG